MTVSQGPVGGTFVWRGRQASTMGSDGWQLPRRPLGQQLESASAIMILDPLTFPWEELRLDHIVRPMTIVLCDEADEALVKSAVGPTMWHLLHTAADAIYRSADEAWAHHRDRATNTERLALKIHEHTFLEAIRIEIESIADELGSENVAVRVCGLNAQRWVNPISYMRAVAETDELERATPDGLTAQTTDSPDIVVAHIDRSLTDEDRIATLRRSWQVLEPGSRLVVVVELSHASSVSAVEGLLDAVMTVSGCAATIEEFRTLRHSGDSYSYTALLRYCVIRVPEIDQEAS